MIGQFVTSKAGHDKSQLYVVVKEENDFVYLCDGKLKPLEKPKKKRKKHIQPICKMVAEPLLSKLRENETVYNEEIKYAIKIFIKNS